MQDQTPPAGAVPAGIAAELAALPQGMPAVVMVGGALALLGTYTGTVEVLPGVGDVDQDVIALYLAVPRCTCPNPDNDVDEECPRHYPLPPAEMLKTIARAITVSRGWTIGRFSPAPDGTTAEDMNAASAVCDVLLRPDRSGVTA